MSNKEIERARLDRGARIRSMDVGVAPLISTLARAIEMASPRRTTAAVACAALAAACLFGLLSTRRDGSTREYHTCDRCQSVRETLIGHRRGRFATQTETTFLHRGRGLAECDHRWRRGMGHATLAPIGCGVVVLARRGDHYGAFILRAQSVSPPNSSYDWWYRSDGHGRLTPGDPGVHAGQGNGTTIAFGPFQIGWAPAGEGMGRLLYSWDLRQPPFLAGAESGLAFCVTDERTVHGVDAAADHWAYATAPFLDDD